MVSTHGSLTLRLSTSPVLLWRSEGLPWCKHLQFYCGEMKVYCGVNISGFIVEKQKSAKVYRPLDYHIIDTCYATPGVSSWDSKDHQGVMKSQ